MTRISTITITLGLTLLTIILALFKCCDLQEGSSWKGFREVPGLFTAVVWSAPTAIHMSWYLWRRLHQNSVLALGLQHWMMPCTWQGGHFLTRCTALSCSGRGLGQHVLRFSTQTSSCQNAAWATPMLSRSSPWVPGQEVSPFYTKLYGQKVVANRLTSWRALCTDHPITRTNIMSTTSTVVFTKTFNL